ncbi:MAG: ABC transporter ATP-binding protein [Phycisphaerae bacterium]|jgi:lipopolysaccharide transport system ATP-binding protein
MSADLAISVENIGKAYRIWESPTARLTSPLMEGAARLLPGAPAQWLMSKAGRSYRDFWALQAVSFTVCAGESVGIVGRNGSGKSTLLQIIAGTMQSTQGSVQVTGRVAALLELGSGFNPEFTGRENIFLSGAIYGLGKDEMARRFDDIAAFAEIGDFIEQPIKTYSSGMQLRLAFAVATALKPDILIVDEALSVGDAYFQAKCHERIADYKKNGMALLLVTHATEHLVRQCDRALFLRDGLLEKDGDPREVTNLYLDDLFGKRKPTGSNPRPGASWAMMTDDQDVFHTRPGYRKEEHRWGHGGAQILDYLVTVNGEDYPPQIESLALAEFYFKVRFDHAASAIVPGFLIKTLEGIILYGTNSFHASRGAKTISVVKGEILLFKFSLPAALNIGHYLVSFGVSTGDPVSQLTPLDRRYDSLLICVSREMPFWGITDLQAAFEVVARR